MKDHYHDEIINSYDNPEEEKQALAKELDLLGFELVFTSESGSLYFHTFFKNESVTVRLSDHNIPETEERNEGKSPYDYELLFDQGFEDDNKETLDFLKWFKQKIGGQIMKPEPKGNTPRQSFRLTENDNELIRQIMEKYNLPNKTIAVKFALCSTAASFKIKK